MSFSNNKKELTNLTRIAKDRNIQKYDYKKFKDIKSIAVGGFGIVSCAYSKVLEKHVALKCLFDENNIDFYKAFMNELQNINAVNHHKNIIKFYGVSIDESAEKCYLVLQYAEDGNLRTYLKNNFVNLDWKTKIRMAQDITNGLCYMHESNIVHRDLHSKNVLVHEGRLLITDLGLSKRLDANSNSFAGGTCAYSDPEYLRNLKTYKRNKASDIYSLGVLLWELSSGKPPFNALMDFDIYFKILSGKRETSIKGTPDDYIKIYSNAWEDNPEKRPTIENIRDSLENVQKQLMSTSLENLENLEIAGNPGESSTLLLNSYDQEWLNNELKKYGYNVFENLEEIGESIYNATLMNGEKKVNLKSIVIDSMELFVNEGNREDPIHGTPQNYVTIYQDCWNQDPDQRPNIEKVIQDLEHVGIIAESVE
ncbi:7047_t:CDS:2 [Diversispora eburnea]|uniref:7047_t:CDS:1 n=1 Tax=Diversispora eburnea TaxID=1213867 RepID=A0A9N9EY93_9GLOM|nr:7047_t:CDS:2 [Diversispora eburnea]